MIYLDHNATTHLHPNVKDVMQQLIDGEPMNPSAIHAFGRKGKSILESTRRSIANLLGFSKSFRDYQVSFTSGGTEANNLILSNFKDGEIFVSAIEHPSIIEHSKFIDNITLIKVDNNGLLNLEDLSEKLKNSQNTKKLLCVMLANNETGVIQPISKIAKIAHQHDAFLHSDCVQAIGKINVDIIEMGIDFASISAHKFGGPVGAGALISKSTIALSPLIIGGGQEKSLRGGTENILSIAGFGEAAKLAKEEIDSRYLHMKKLHNKLEDALLTTKHNIEIVAMDVDRLPNTTLLINIDKKAETQLIALDLKGVAISSGSACSSGKANSSHVLSAMGYSQDQVNSALRISSGVNTTEQDIDNFLKIYNEINK